MSTSTPASEPAPPSSPAVNPTPELISFFDRERFDSDLQKYLILLYAPLGLILCILRVFIAIHMYVVASLLPKMTSVRSVVLEGMMFVLGVRIKRDTTKATKCSETRILISNHVTKFDYLPFHVALSCYTPNIHSFLFPLGGAGGEALGLINLGRNSRFSRSTFLSKLKSHLSKTEAPVVMFPEETNTNGKKGLLKFSSWPVSACNCVQPVILSATRPVLSVSLSPIPSSWLSDLFWTLFTPCTVYTIKFLPVLKRQSNESDEDLTARIEVCLASESGLPQSGYTAQDKYDLEKRVVCALAARQRNNGRLFDSRLYREAERVREIMPHIPLNTIVRELGRSHGDPDVTIARLIDTYPSRSASSNTSFNTSSQSPSPAHTPQFKASPQNRMSAFAEKKTLFIAEARRRYIQKHGLKVAS